MPVLAVPYLLPFAELAGIAIAGLSLMEISNRVQAHMEANPEETFRILKLIMPREGIAAMFEQLFKKKAGDDEVTEEIEVEEKPKRKKSKKEIVLEGLRRARAGKGNYSDPDATGPAVSARGNIIRGLEEHGKVPGKPDPDYDPDKKYKGYKKFIYKGRRDRAKGGIMDVV
jgi:hypothetical protein